MKAGTTGFSEEWLHTVARGAIECHLGDLCDETTCADVLYDNAFTLAHDALVDNGVPPEVASEVATLEAQRVAQP